MKTLIRIYAATSIVSVLTAGVLGFALIQEAARSSEYSQKSYKNGLRDGEVFARGQIIRSQVEQEIINEQRSKIAKEKL